MGRTVNLDPVKVTEIFLIPCSFLVAALGTADTNPHRAGVSVIGLVVSALWWVCVREAFNEESSAGPDTPPMPPNVRVRVLWWLPVFFAACWVLSVVAHVLLWTRPLGH